MIEASQRMIAVHSQGAGGEAKEGWGINPAMKRHLELEIKRLFSKCSKRCEDKLRELLKLKEKQNEQEATHMLKIFKG